MRFLVLFWVGVELVQIAVIVMLAVGYRNLQRKFDAGERFAQRPPRSVTEE